MENNKKDDEVFQKAKIKKKDGVGVAYDKNEFKKLYPNLMTEISNKQQSIKIDSVKIDEQNNEERNQNQYKCLPNELINPGAIDFIRRCTKNEEAFEILDYLLKREELSLEEYNFYKKQIMKEGGLKKLIEKSGGPKLPGYYIEKYYKKEINDQKLKSKKN
ncbi:MAG: DUF2095 family protein [Promethearchaeota archaeon]